VVHFVFVPVEEVVVFAVVDFGEVGVKFGEEGYVAKDYEVAAEVGSDGEASAGVVESGDEAIDGSCIDVDSIGVVGEIGLLCLFARDVVVGETTGEAELEFVILVAEFEACGEREGGVVVGVPFVFDDGVVAGERVGTFVKGFGGHAALVIVAAELQANHELGAGSGEAGEEGYSEKYFFHGEEGLECEIETDANPVV